MIKRARGSSFRLLNMTNNLRLRGRISVYSADANGGIIICEAGNTYLFSRNSWDSHTEPQVDLIVFFIPAERNIARYIVPEHEFIDTKLFPN